MSGFYYIKIANGLLEPKHVEAMGESVWLYMWLQDKCTSVNENGEGKVLGNRPIVYEIDIAPALGCSRQTYGRWIKKLRDAGYVKTLRTPVGLSVIITKAKKYRSAKSEHHQGLDSDVPNPSINSDVPKSSTDVPKSKREVPKSSIQYKTKQDYTKTIQNTTDVVEPPARYGKPEINVLFDYWSSELQYDIATKVTANRRAAANLLKKFGEDKLKALIRGVALAQNNQYAPRIGDFCDLQSKANQLMAWGKQQHGEEQRARSVRL